MFFFLQWRADRRFNHVLHGLMRARAWDPKTNSPMSRQNLNRFSFGLERMDDVATMADLHVLREAWGADSAAGVDTSNARAAALEVAQKLGTLAQLRLDYVARVRDVAFPKWKGLFTGNAVEERRRRL